MINYFWYIDGDKFGMDYHMIRGSIIPTHSHEEPMLHDVNVLIGHVEVITADGVLQGVDGERLTFDGTKPHSIRALTHSVIRNMFLNGMPTEYRSLPESEHSGVIP
jgi:hypothetical protein